MPAACRDRTDCPSSEARPPALDRRPGSSSAPLSRRHHRCGTAPGSHRLRWGSAILAQARTPVAYRSRPVRPWPVARAVDSPADKSAPAGDNFPVAVDSGVDSENGPKLCGQGLVPARRLAVERLSPLRRARPEGNSGTAGGRGDRPSPTGARCRWRPRGVGRPDLPEGSGRPAVARPSRPLHLIHGGASSYFDGCPAGSPVATRGTTG